MSTLSLYRSTFFKTNLINAFDKQNVFYVAYVGNHAKKDGITVPVFKYGISTDIFTRIYTAHMKTFPEFEIQTILITDKKEIVEKSFERELKIRSLHMKMKFKGKQQVELFHVNDIYPIEDVLNISFDLVHSNNVYVPQSKLIM
jgi:hypothetical protein